MNIRGKLWAETPVYRGNARKTLFTRDGDGTHRLLSLAGEISGTAESLMDAFIGESRNGRNSGLLNQMWLRLYGEPMPRRLIASVNCKLAKESYPPDNLFDMRMGLRLDEDRWAAESNANYKMETVFRNSAFDFEMAVNDDELKRDDSQARLYYLLQELQEGRFWFGAGKSKGLGRFRLKANLPFAPGDKTPPVDAAANYMTINLAFDASNPILVGWNWGKVDPSVPSFAAVEGRLLVEAMRDLPEAVQTRLALSLGGPILGPEDWKNKFVALLPRAIAIWLREQSTGEVESWTLSATELSKLSKGKYALSKKVVEAVHPLVDKPFASQAAAEAAIDTALGGKSNMTGRLVKAMTRTKQARHELDADAWQELAAGLGFDPALHAEVVANLGNEADLTRVLAQACQSVLPRLNEQVDQQIRLLRSDAWVDDEISARRQHLQIKQMLLRGQINEAQWNDRNRPPQGIGATVWRSFLDDHRRVRYQHMLNRRNLEKSIANDENMIAFLQSYRNQARQELAQPYNVDFRAGGPFNRIVSRKYGKPYDTVFMRMLSWTPSDQERGTWEIYIPGSTIKGAFRKRASQILRTLWGESGRTNAMIDHLFGTQGRRGLVFFSDAYLVDPIDPDRDWCSMDGVRMDPATGKPIENAKLDCLFAYGSKLAFRCRLDLQDLDKDDLESLQVLFHLLQDFQRGDVPLGGSKSNGMGWVQATVTGLEWLTGDTGGVHRALFGDKAPAQEGLWHRLTLDGPATAQVLGWTEANAIKPLSDGKSQPAVPRTRDGFVSHRAFGGYCGTLVVEAEVLTPLHVRESGDATRKTTLDGNPINGWDFFSMAPPDPEMRPDQKQYALPSKSLKGMLRHIYTIASDAHAESTDIAHLNPADSLFGWVGNGPNQALMGRLSFSFARFEQPELAWFKAPYPYGGWRFNGKVWEQGQGKAVQMLTVAKQWRVFAHAPLAPIVKQQADFSPDSPQASYGRAILPGARARFNIRFWNLEETEMARLIWSIALETGLAHKLGKNRYLGFGSLRLHILPDSFTINWAKRYADAPPAEWKQPVQVQQWIRPQDIANYQELKKALNAECI